MRLSLKSSIHPPTDLSMNFLGSLLLVSVLLMFSRYLHTVLHTVEGVIQSIRWTIRPPSKPYPRRRIAWQSHFFCKGTCTRSLSNMSENEDSQAEMKSSAHLSTNLSDIFSAEFSIPDLFVKGCANIFVAVSRHSRIGTNLCFGTKFL